MKKALALFCLVFIFSVGVCAFEFIQINGQKENVSFTAIKEEGDKKYADGLNIRLVQQHLDRLQWKTDYSFGETDKVKTDFEFHKRYLSKNRQSKPYFNIYSSNSGGFDTIGDGVLLLNSAGINKAYLELALEAQPDVKTEKTIYLKDYYEYYPIYIVTDLDHYGLTIGENIVPSVEEEEEWYTEEEEDLFKRMTEFLRIPVRENEKLTISLTKSAEGYIYEMGCSSLNDDCYSIGTVNAVSKDTIYFAVNIRSENGEKADTSLIPGGYGIYAFDYTLKNEGRSDGSSTADFGEIKNIYPLHEDQEITGFFLSADESTLYFSTNENGSSYLNIIDAKTHACRQRLKMSDEETAILSPEKYTDDYLVLSCCDALFDNCYYAVVTIEKDGKHRLEYMVSYNNESCSFLYENGLLYAVSDVFQNYDLCGMYYCAFIVSVYAKDGIKYYGEYLSSLNTGNTMDYFSNYYVFSYAEQDELALAA